VNLTLVQAASGFNTPENPAWLVPTVTPLRVASSASYVTAWELEMPKRPPSKSAPNRALRPAIAGRSSIDRYCASSSRNRPP
jgi:hypothetical protein